MIKDRRNILYWVLTLFIFTIPLSQYVSVRILVVLNILVLVLLYSKEMLKQVAIKNWDIIVYILMLIVGVFYSNDKIQAWRVLETSFSFLGIPLAYEAYQKDASTRVTTKVFSLAVLIAGLILILNATFKYFHTSDGNVFLFYQLTDPLGLQPTYLAYYVIFVITCIIFEMYYKTIGISIMQLSICIIFLSSILLFTGGKTAFISLILVSSFFALKYLLDIRSLRRTYTVVTFFSILIVFVSISTSDYFASVSLNQTDFWERSTLWRSAIEANPNPIFGVGTGDYKDVLNQYYKAQGMTQFAAGNYNAHNQFIQLYFSNGVLGLLALLLIIGRPLYLSFKIQNTLGILLVFPFILYGITEVFLARYQGVVFFVLCHQIVVSDYYLKIPKLNLKTI